jgi:hypothetical protein
MDIESMIVLKRDVPAVEEFLSSTGGGPCVATTTRRGLYWAVIRA